MYLESFIGILDSLVSSRRFKPHKYLLLLSVIEIIRNNTASVNRFYYKDVIPYYNKYFLKFAEDQDRNRPYIPFFHLQSSGFWHLKAKAGKEEKLNNLTTASSRRDIENNVDFAFLSGDVFELLSNREYAEIITDYITHILDKRKTYAEKIKEEKTDYSNTSLFKHEEEAITKIISGTKQFGKVISNVLLFEDQSDNYLEYDIIFVSFIGIFVIELKHWSGNIKIAPYNWIVNDFNYRNDPHKINSFKCKVLKGIYQHKFRTYPNIYVQSVVILTNPEAVVEGATTPKAAVEAKNRNLSFASIQDFITYLKMAYKVKEAVLSSSQVDNIANYFSSLNQPKRDIKYIVPGYETIEYISQNRDYIELIARSIEGKHKRLYRFRIFRPPINATVEEKERFKKRAYNTMNTVSQIGNHPNILKVWVIKNDQGDIIEGSEWSEIGTLRDLISGAEQDLDIHMVLELCGSIARALKTAHDVGVIHRNLRPENILMFNNIPKLINFDLAYQVEDNRVTVIADTSTLKDDGYFAPEILANLDIDETTDYFSLGIIAYELITGQKPFSSTRAFISQGGLSEEAKKVLRNSRAPEHVKSFILELLKVDRNQRINNPEQIMSTFGVKDADLSTNIILGNAELKPGEHFDMFEIVEMIGEGGEAQIYKARTLQFNPNSGEEEEKIVALKVFNREVAIDKIRREYGITSAIQSAYTVRCERLGYKKNRYFLVLDYLEGKSLRDYISEGIRPDYNEFLKVAYGLMEAVKSLHNYKVDEETPKPYLHSDIKPDNIIVLPDGKPVLIDFGIAGEPRVDSFQGTSDYISPDSILGVDMKFSQDGDLYSLGVTLWEWVFGTKPYVNAAVGEVPSFPGDAPFEMTEHLKKWFLKAVATISTERFTSIDEMKNAVLSPPEVKTEEKVFVDYESEIDVIETQVEKHPDLKSRIDKNEFVQYLNSLSNVSAGNENATAESQALNNYFSKISVRSSLTDYIYDVLTHQKRNVILTGNAGDGKTTIAAQIRKMVCKDNKPLARIEMLPGAHLIIVKDMSELNIKERINIMMQLINDTENNYLLVSNTGTLLDVFAKSSVDITQNEVLEALSSDKPSQLLEGHLELINIGSINSINTACEVFRKMIANDNWNKCVNCSWAEDCPIFFNAKLLQAKEDIVIERVSLIYRRLYEYYIRLTMRQMIGHLAYSITAGLTCGDIAKKSYIELRNSVSRFLFINLFFGDDGETEVPLAMQLQTIKHIQKNGFGLYLEPSYEREIWARRDLRVLEQENIPQNVIERISHILNNPKNNSYRKQVRRLLYFLGDMVNEKGQRFISVFLRSPMLQKYIEFTDDLKMSSLDERKYRLRVLQVFQEFIAGVRLPEGKWEKQADYLYITLNREGFSSGTQILLADLRISDFKLDIKTRYQAANEKNNILVLLYKDVPLELDLPFLDYVARRYKGEIAEELSSYYSDRLNKYKVKLLELDDRHLNDYDLNLLMIEKGRTFKVMKMSFVDDKLEVIF